MCSFLLLILVFNLEAFRVIRTRAAMESRREQRCSLLWRGDRRARRKLEQRQPQIAHFQEDTVERRLVTDVTGKQRCTIALVCDREVLKPLLPEGVQMSLHANDISHTLVLRSDDVSSSRKKDTLWTGETQSPKGYQKATFERREEQREEHQMVAFWLPCRMSCI